MATFIATIGSSDFMLESIEQAEQLLRILSAATLVDDYSFDEPGTGYRRVFYLSNGDKHVSVKLLDSKPVSYQEYTKLRDDAVKARARAADKEAA